MIYPHKKTDPALIKELGGAMTHKILLDKERLLSDTHDNNGNLKTQYMIKEMTQMTINSNIFIFSIHMFWKFVADEELSGKWIFKRA